jgi:chromosome segregation ATPase
MKQLPRIYYILYQRKIRKNQDKLRKAINDVGVASKSITSLLTQEQNYAQSLEQAHEEVRKLERDLIEVDTIISRLKSELVKLGVSQDELAITSIYQVDDIGVQTSASEIAIQLATVQSRKHTLLASFASVSAEISGLNEQYSSRKHLLAQLQSASSNSDPSQHQTYIKERISSLEKERISATEEIDNLESESARIEESLDRNKQLLNQLQSERDQSAAGMEDLIGKFAILKAKRTEVSANIVNIGAELCSAKQKTEQQAAELHEKRKTLSCRSGDVQMTSILKLKEELAANPIDGVYGLLIDITKVPDKIRVAYEVLLGSKLFSFVVRDQEAANQLIKINKQIQGGRILVYPLSWMEEQISNSDEHDAAAFRANHKMLRNTNFTYPADIEKEKCIILESHMEVTFTPLKEDTFMHRLLAMLLKGKLMVPDLEVANKLAHAYDCDCVTFSSEIVYAKGFLSKLGSDAVKSNNLSDYLKFREALRNYQDLCVKLKGINIQYDNLKAEELKISAEIQDMNIRKEKELSLLSRLWEDLAEYQRAVIQCTQVCEELSDRKSSLQNFLHEIDSEIFKLKQMLVNLESGNYADISKDPSKISEQINIVVEELSADKRQILSKSAIQRDLQEAVSNLDREECSLLEKRVRRERSDLSKQFRDKESTFMSKNMRRNEQLIQDLTSRLALKQSERKNMKNALVAAEENAARTEVIVAEKRKLLKEAQLQMQSLNQRRFDLQISTDTFEQKLANLNMDGDDEQHNKHINSLNKQTDLELVGKLKQLMIAKMKYTQKDKDNFEQLERFFLSHSQLEGELKNLDAGKIAFAQMTSTLPADIRHNGRGGRGSQPQELQCFQEEVGQHLQAVLPQRSL